jgi:glycosyltransferase involved in cell wall biosynthesis
LKQSHPRQNWLSRDDIVNLLDLAGFEVVHSEGALLFPKYIPIVSALLNAVLAKLPLLRQLTVTQFIVARPRHEPPAEDAAAYTVSIVVPARNEAGNIEAAIARTPAMGLWTEFIFVEGHSQDNTWETIQRVQTEHSEHRIIAARQPGKGKKDAMLTGYAYCTGDIIMILDADLTMPPEELPKFYRAIASNKGEFINGVRLVYPMEDKAMRLLNLFGNKFFSLAFSYILGQPYKDTLCGTKVFWRHDYERMAANRAYFGDFDPFGDFDLIFGAAKLALKAVQMPIHYKERTYGSTQISRFSHGWLLLKMTWVGLRKFKWWV